ncbi:MAG: bactofilin family protein [Casimicrobiaceae bacterium]|jgi:cytoskeletal protein CcmA (bactofilin family)
MFTAKKQAAPQKRLDSLIGAGTIVRGDLLFTGGLRVDGRVEGNVSTADGQAGTLVISEHAHIDGEVRVSHVVINGTVTGPVHAAEYLELQPKARIVGDVSYRKLEMHMGAVIEGRLAHGADEPETGSVVELKRVSAD